MTKITKIEVEKLINWIKAYFEEHAFLKGVTLGMSGGKDSLIVAKLFCEALGKEKVFGVIMPNEEMPDLKDAVDTCNLLGIKYTIVNINETYLNILNPVKKILALENVALSTVSTLNLPPRIRMSFLYTIAGSLNHIVANTSNLSEIAIGYSTKWGDNVGDISPLANFTKDEVCQIGHLLGLPKYLVEKAPADGLTGKTDEEVIGVSYNELETIIRTGEKTQNYDKVISMMNKNKHKIYGMIKYDSKRKNYIF